MAYQDIKVIFYCAALDFIDISRLIINLALSSSVCWAFSGEVKAFSMHHILPQLFLPCDDDTQRCSAFSVDVQEMEIWDGTQNTLYDLSYFLSLFSLFGFVKEVCKCFLMLFSF